MLRFKRIVVCLDIKNGKVTKGIKFRDNINVGDPVELAAKYSREGADVVVFYDISASMEKRSFDAKLASAVVEVINVPYVIGGGVATLADISRALEIGAVSVSINTPAIRQPEIIREGARQFGERCIMLGVDAAARPDNPNFPSGYEIMTNGGLVGAGMDAVEWCKRGVDLGAGEICLNVVDTDGMRQGYDLNITRQVANAVPVPVIASGGGGEPKHLLDALTIGEANAALIASMAHIGGFVCSDLKKYLRENGVNTKP